MRILADTNVVLDALLERLPFYQPAAQVLAAVEEGAASGSLCSTTITTVYYVARKHVGSPGALDRVRGLLKLFDAVPISRAMFLRAAELGFRDFEDAVLHEAAVEDRAEAIVTRNVSDFRNSRVPVLTPDEFLAKLGSLRA